MPGLKDEVLTQLSSVITTEIIPELESRVKNEILTQVRSEISTILQNADLGALTEIAELKELRKVKVMRNCEELSEQGVTTSGNYFIGNSLTKIKKNP